MSQRKQSHSDFAHICVGYVVDNKIYDSPNHPAHITNLALTRGSWSCKKVYFYLYIFENDQQSKIHGFVRISDL
jgi:hypothetical protein